MPFRERIKKAFKSSPSSTPKNSPNPTSDDARWPSNVYAPGEPMPRPKYRAPVKKDHKDKLDSFSFGESWRRKSHVSEYSPHGSRMPSRRASLISRKSFGGRSRKSIGGGSTSGPAGGDSADLSRKSQGGPRSDDGRDPEGRPSSDVGSEKRFKDPHGAAKPTRLSVEVEQDGDDDIFNVGLSRVGSRDNRSSEQSPTKTNGASTHHARNGIAAHDHQPFTEDDLALAMKRSHLTVPARG